MFRATAGFENLTFSDCDEDVEEEAVTPVSVWTEATGGKSLMFLTPSPTGLTGGQGVGIYQKFV